MNHVYYNHFRLGDCLWHCHWLRKAACANPGHTFEFYCNTEHHWQLREVLADLPQIQLRDIVEYRGGGVNCWINATGEFPPRDGDMINFLTHVYHRVAQESGLESPITQRAEWLFDYPALSKAVRTFPNRKPCEALMVNSPPLSGQFRFDAAAMQRLTNAIFQTGRNLQVTHEPPQRRGGFSVTDFGAISKTCKLIIMVSTGPSWPTFNAVTEANVQERLILLGGGLRLNYGREWPHFDSVEGAEKYLAVKGLL